MNQKSQRLSRASKKLLVQWRRVHFSFQNIILPLPVKRCEILRTQDMKLTFLSKFQTCQFLPVSLLDMQLNAHLSQIMRTCILEWPPCRWRDGDSTRNRLLHALVDFSSKIKLVSFILYLLESKFSNPKISRTPMEVLKSAGFSCYQK